MTSHVRGFWGQTAGPVVALSPMDGLTDAAARCIALRHGKPDFTVTEFVAVEGLTHGGIALLDDFLHEASDRPVVAQLYGIEPAAFREAAAIATALGFDGVDINMGCPAATVARRGAGAALIRTPDLAKEIVRATRAGIDDWANGGSLDRLVSHNRIRRMVRARCEPYLESSRRRIPVSVKTRIGFDNICVEQWASHLSEAEPIAITFHGRTLKQLYGGSARWDAIGRAADTLRGSGILVLGNGDIEDRNHALSLITEYGLDGAMIGRATVGNPWVLRSETVSTALRLRTAMEHAELFEHIFPNRPYMAVRKHLHGYCRGFDGASNLRKELMLSPSAAHSRRMIERILEPIAAQV